MLKPFNRKNFSLKRYRAARFIAHHHIAQDGNYQTYNITLTPNWSGQRVEFLSVFANNAEYKSYPRTEISLDKFPHSPDV